MPSLKTLGVAAEVAMEGDLNAGIAKLMVTLHGQQHLPTLPLQVMQHERRCAHTCVGQ